MFSIGMPAVGVCHRREEDPGRIQARDRYAPRFLKGRSFSRELQTTPGTPCCRGSKQEITLDLEAIRQALDAEKAVEGADLAINRFRLQVA